MTIPSASPGCSPTLAEPDAVDDYARVVSIVSEFTADYRNIRMAVLEQPDGREFEIGILKDWQLLGTELVRSSIPRDELRRLIFEKAGIDPEAPVPEKPPWLEW